MADDTPPAPATGPGAPADQPPADQAPAKQEITGRPVPLPATLEDMLAMRKSQLGLTLNDYVEELHKKKWVDPKYRSLLEAVYPEDAVEGSLQTDDHEAARMLREQAIKDGNPYVRGRKLSTIIRALHVVMRRYQISRKERALTIGGQRIRNDNED